MKESLKSVVETITHDPKTAWALVPVAWGDWIVANFDGILSTAAKLLSVVLIPVLIRYHWANTSKVNAERKKIEKDSQP